MVTSGFEDGFEDEEGVFVSDGCWQRVAEEGEDGEKIGDVMIGGGLGDYTSDRVLDHSEIGLLGEGERVAIVHTGGGKAVDKDGWCGE